jgi:WhiB family redox-sensing transcriptional regulator
MTITIAPPDLEGAICAQVDVGDVFFPENGGSTADAKRICRRCPVRTACLDYALSNDERFGVWGGLSEQERRKIAVQMPVAAPVEPAAPDDEHEHGSRAGYDRHRRRREKACAACKAAASADSLKQRRKRRPTTPDAENPCPKGNCSKPAGHPARCRRIVVDTEPAPAPVAEQPAEPQWAYDRQQGWQEPPTEQPAVEPEPKPQPARRRRKTPLERDLIAQGYSAEYAARRAGVA